MAEHPRDPLDIGLISAADPETAGSTQELLRTRCNWERTIDTSTIRLVAGADAAYSEDAAYAAVTVLSFPEMECREVACTAQPIRFPYIPGLLSFREGPPVIEAFRSLSCYPDVLVVNGHGYAHPRRIGLACHLGIVLGVPSIGVAQRLLVGTSDTPGPHKGDREPVHEDDEILGMAVRTKEGQKPVFVSAGYMVDLPQAVDMVLKTATVHRMPEPLHIADVISREYRRSGTCRHSPPGHSTS